MMLPKIMITGRATGQREKSAIPNPVVVITDTTSNAASRQACSTFDSAPLCTSTKEQKIAIASTTSRKVRVSSLRKYDENFSEPQTTT